MPSILPDTPMHLPPGRSAARGVRPASAFSIVEIMLAIGVVAFAFVALMGLLPVGLDGFRNALDTSVRSQIVQRLVTDAQQTDFEKLKAQAGQFRFFDDEGTEVPAGASIYTASLLVEETTELPKATVTENLLTLQIRIAANPGRVADPFLDPARHRTTTHVAFVARNR